MMNQAGICGCGVDMCEQDQREVREEAVIWDYGGCSIGEMTRDKGEETQQALSQKWQAKQRRDPEKRLTSQCLRNK